MIITGDIAVPTIMHSRQLKDIFTTHHQVFKGKTIICNFEGLLNDKIIQSNEPVLNNHPSLLKVLKDRGGVVACLANNHILDLPLNFNQTLRAFNNQGILFTGAGKSKEEAEEPALFYENGKQVIVYNACWDFLLYNHKNPMNNVYVSVINEESLSGKVSQSRRNRPKAAIIVFLHWNFDLENLPFPMHRQIAKELIDKGADIVVGTHSHCIQGGERYKDGYVVYGLGNFYIPNNEFAMGKLSFPSFARMEMVLEWDVATGKVICHWFKIKGYGSNQNLLYLGHEIFEESKKLIQYSPYQGMSESEYLIYFKKFRRKKFLIPIYIDYRRKTINYFITSFLKNRAYIARTLAKLKIIDWQR